MLARAHAWHPALPCPAHPPAGSPCCLPVHDPAEQAHSSAPGSAARPSLLLASGSGAQQHSIAEPFTVAELQRAAATVAADGAKAAARSQFFVQQLAGARGETGGGAGRDAAGSAAGAGRAAAAPAAAAAAAGAEAADDGAGGRYNLSGAAGGSSGEEGEGEPASGAAHAGAHSPPSEAGAGAALAAGAGAAVGLPAAGCWLELHVLGRRAEWKTAALAAALLLDGQPGWLRGGCMFGVLPLAVSTAVQGARACCCARASQLSPCSQPVPYSIASSASTR